MPIISKELFDKAAEVLPPKTPDLDYQYHWQPSDEDKQALGQPTGYQDPTANWNYKNAQQGPQGQSMVDGQLGWTPDGARYFGGDSDLANWWNGLLARVKTPLTRDGKEVAYDDVPIYDLGKIAETTWRAGAEVLGGILELAKVPSLLVEGFRSGLNEAAGLKSEAPEQDWGWWNWARDGIANITRAPLEIGGAVSQFIVNPDVAAEKFGKGWAEGRIYYSNIGDPVRQAEYLRRLNSGENPYLLSQELADPIKELVGQLPFDPLNFSGFITKPLRALGMTSKIERWAIRAAPVFDDVLDGIRATGQLGKITSTAEAGEGLAKLVTSIVAHNGDNLAAELGKVDSRLIGFEWKGIVPRIFSPRTPTSAKAFAAEDFSTIVGRIFANTAGNANKIDDALDIAQALTKLHGAEDDVLQGLTTLENLGFPVEVALSEAGRRSGLILKKILEMGDINIIDELKRVTANTDVIKTFGGVIDKAIDAVYPSNLDLTGITGAARKLLDTPFYRKNYEFFGSVYMGYNPAFAARAYLTDIFHGFTDIKGGMSGLFHIGEITDDTSRMFGGILPRAFDEGVTLAGEGLVKGKGLGPFADAASRGQASVSKVTFHYAAREMFEQGYGVIAKNTFGSLKEAGATEEMLSTLSKYMRETGNANDAVARLLQDIDVGFVEGRNMTWLDDIRRSTLQQFGFGNKYIRSIANTKTLDEALAAHQSVLDDVVREMRNAGKSGINLTEADDVLGHGAQLMEAQLEGAQGKITSAMSKIEAVANKEVEFLSAELLSDMKDIAARYGVNDLGKLVPEDLRGYVDGSWLTDQRLSFRKSWDDKFSWLDRLKKEATPDLRRYWEQFLQIPGKFPEGITKENFIHYFYEGYYHPTKRNFFSDMLSGADGFIGKFDDALTSITNSGKIPNIAELTFQKRKSVDAALKWASELGGYTLSGVENTLVKNGNLTDILRLTSLNNIGIDTERLLNTINKYLPEGVAKFTDISLVPYDVVEQALKQRAIAKGIDFVELGNRFTDGVPELTDIIPGISRYADGGDVFTPGRVLAEQRTGIEGIFNELEQLLRQNYTKPVNMPKNPELVSAVEQWTKTAQPMMYETAIMADKYGTAMRDFTVLPYLTGKTNIDTVLSTIYPYAFWPTRTYLNWGKRIAYNPEMIAAYAKYRNTLENIHKESPDWYRYSLRSDELFGLFPNNPIFFNLESQLNPVNGLVGVDFDDPRKRVNWWTSALDDLGKWGSSPWSFLNIAAAIALKATGDEDAASRWAGRIPQSQWLRGAISLTTGAAIDPDPLQFAFGGGIDPYIRSTGIPRALAQMELEGVYTHDQLIDAAAQQSGAIWDEAYRRAVNNRAPGNVLSSFIGGINTRTMADLQADEFYTAQSRVIAQRDFVSPEAYRDMWDQLRQKYPFSDAMLLAKKAGDDRDAALAYNILSRIPPAQSDDLAKLVGGDYSLFSKFFDTKGDFSEWAEPDHMKFMASVMDLQAILATPADATRQEWTQVKNLRSQVDDAMQLRFGGDILDQIDNFYAQYATNKDVRPSVVVSQALDFKDKAIASNPLLATYYGGIDAIAKYYEGLMYNDIESQLGADIQIKFGNDTITDSERRRYYSIKNKWQAQIDARILKVGTYLPEAQGATVRPDAEPQTQSQEELLAGLQVPYVSGQDIVDAVGETSYGILQDYLLTGTPLNYRTRAKIEEYAQSLGMSFYELIGILQNQGTVQFAP